MRFIVLFASLMFAIGYTSAAKADLLIEPGLGYLTGTYDGGSGNSGKVSGFGLNARAAYTFPMIFVGADINYAFGTTSPDSGPSSDTTWVGIGPVVGVSLPVLPLRFWLSYYLLDYATTKVASTDFVYSGSALKLGAGYTFLPMISVNLEYAMHTYTKAENKSAGTSGDLSPNVKQNVIVLSASIPLDL